MKPTFEEIEELFKVPADEGYDKTTSLKDAVKKYLKPGMYYHLGAAANLPYGFAYEITRQFWGTDARFKVSCLGASSNIMMALSSTIFNEPNRIIDEIITTYAGDIYPAPAPNKIMMHVFQEGKVKIQNYSLLSMILRFFAGAQNLPLIPVRTITDTSIKTENENSVLQIDNPFDPTQKVTVLKPLNPDVAFMHGIWADKHGNTLLMPPYTGYMWGVLASKKIIVSAEKIVPTETIRKYNYLARIPGHRVSAVVELPFGAHPSANRGIAGVDYGYGEDYDFIVKWRESNRSSDRSFTELKEWLDYWVLGINHEEYLKKIGQEKLDFLKNQKSHPDFWKTEIKDALKGNKIKFETPPTSTEIMASVMANIGAERIKKNGYKTILAGQGISNLAAWLCHKKLLAEDYPVELMAEVGFYGYYPRPSSPFIFEFTSFPTCKSLCGVFETLGYSIQGFMSNNIGFLGAGQIDKHGNINSTKAGNYYLVGSGGAGDVCGCSKETLVCINHQSLRVLKEVPYITGSGKNVKTVITNLGVLEKLDGELALKQVVRQKKDKPLNRHIRKIKRNTG
ncbi:MAG: hypothetical protein GF364_16665, partial [Candidatus Lokiarchaeota archaeon]|nr:hypothetical protein [Candidatus Lokiarchaeota archaeon]